MTPAAAAEEVPAIEFTGTLREYVPIAVTNALLSLVTLFVYRSWAKARSRRYIWNHTRFIDDELQWTGTGVEMFVGFIIAALMIATVGFIINVGLPALAVREGAIVGFVALIAVYAGGMFLFGLARFRALRYRLARTLWRGIRGGSDDGGWTYARKAIGYYFASFLLFGLAYPWAQAKLWNERWNKMSFGPHRFEANLVSEDTRGAFFLLWGAIVGGTFIVGVFTNPNVVVMGPGYPQLVVPLLVYAGIGAMYVNYLASFYQAAVESTRIADLEFRLTAEFSDWLKFFAITVGLTIVTLGLAMLVYDFRKWRFIASHLEAYGMVDVDTLTQSRTAAPRDAEGILDALDIGAF
jgi:uncharacterized membrane protein YjgN (DUF898 family)